MGSCSLISVSFWCTENDGVARLANWHLLKLEAAPNSDWEHKDRLHFLSELSCRTGENPGTKGGFSLWSTVGRALDAEKFVQGLTDFWSDLLAADVDGGPSDMDKVVVLYEHEGEGGAHCFEIGLAEGDRDPLTDFLCEHGRPPDMAIPDDIRPPLEIKRYSLPFTWGL